MVPHFHQLADIRKCETFLNVLFKLIGTKENVCIRKEFNSHRICLEHHHGRRFIVIIINTNMTAVTSVKTLSTCYLGLPALSGRAP